jgi:hypothetical protein
MDYLEARYERPTMFFSGIMAGVISGAVMLFMMMIVSRAIGQGFFFPMRLFAATFWGVNALIAGPVVPIVGTIFHLGVSAGLGVIFASLTRPRTPEGSALLGGVIYGIGVWVVMNYLIMPWLNPTMNERINFEPGWFFLSHIAFGACLSITPGIRRSLTYQHVGREEPGRPEERMRRAA